MRFFSRFFRFVFLSKAQFRVLRASFLWAVIAGLLFLAAFPPMEQGWIAFFALAPFLVHLRGKTAKEGAWLGLAFGFCYFYPNLFWLNTLISVNPLAPIGVVLAALICTLAPMVFGALAAILNTRAAGWRLLLVPALWAGLEYLRALTELGFPWIYLGHTQVNALPLIQISDLTGVYGVSFLLVAINQILADTWVRMRHKEGNPRFLGLEWIFGLIALGGVLGYGVFQLGIDTAGMENPESPGNKPPAPFFVALLQQGLPQSEKLASYDYRDRQSADRAERIQAGMYASISAQIEAMRAESSRPGTPTPDLYVLPESAITFPWFYPWFDSSEPPASLLAQRCLELQSLSENWARKAGAPVFFGSNRIAPAQETRSPSDPGFPGLYKLYNSAFLADPETGISRTAYDKMHLVPFGEYASYFDVIPGFTEFILGIGNFDPGEAPAVFRVAGRTFGAVICFESCFPYLFRKYAALDVDWMAVITNDAWYKFSSGARRHQTQSIFRAIEMRRPIVRVANTGISCIIDPRGRVTASLPLSEAGPAQIVAPIPFGKQTGAGGFPLYMRAWGEWFAWFCLAGCAVALGSIGFRGQKKGGMKR